MATPSEPELAASESPRSADDDGTRQQAERAHAGASGAGPGSAQQSGGSSGQSQDAKAAAEERGTPGGARQPAEDGVEPPSGGELQPARPPLGVAGNQNDRLTFAFAATIFTVTFLAWGGAKVACNHHPARYQNFQVATGSRLVSTPKDAALEFHHRLAILDFAGAKELANSSALELVTAAETACDDGCRARAATRATGVKTRATLLTRRGRSAQVRVESFFEGKQEKAATYEVKHIKKEWRIEERTGG